MKNFLVGLLSGRDICIKADYYFKIDSEYTSYMFYRSDDSKIVAEIPISNISHILIIDEKDGE